KSKQEEEKDMLFREVVRVRSDMMPVSQLLVDIRRADPLQQGVEVTALLDGLDATLRPQKVVCVNPPDSPIQLPLAGLVERLGTLMHRKLYQHLHQIKGFEVVA